MKNTCLPFIHEWSKYGEVIQGYSNHKMQVRKCHRCGKVSRAYIGWWNQTDPSQINDSVEKVTTNEHT